MALVVIRSLLMFFWRAVRGIKLCFGSIGFRVAI